MRDLKKEEPNNSKWKGVFFGFLITLPTAFLTMLWKSTIVPMNHQLSWLYYPFFMTMAEYNKSDTTDTMFSFIICDSLLFFSAFQFIFYGYFLGKFIKQKIKFLNTILIILAIHFSGLLLGLVITKPLWVHRLYGNIPFVTDCKEKDKC